MGASPTFEKIGIYHLPDNLIIQEYNQFNQDPILRDAKIRPEKWADYFQEKMLTETKTQRRALGIDFSLPTGVTQSVDNLLQPEAEKLLKITALNILKKAPKDSQTKIIFRWLSNEKLNPIADLTFTQFINSNLIGSEDVRIILDYYPMLSQLKKIEIKNSLPGLRRMASRLDSLSAISIYNDIMLSHLENLQSSQVER